MNVVPIATENGPEPAIDFSTFYTIFPRHEARKDALKAWNSLSATDQYAAIVGISIWRRVLLDRGLQFCPLGATWLRGERWQDELPQEYRAQSSSHVAFVPEVPQSGSRAEIPENVRAMFAKLKAGR